MPNKKHPDRDKFDAEMKVIEQLGPIPSDYAKIIRHSRPDLNKRLLYDVRHSKRVDLSVLAEIRRVVLERATANILHPQQALA
jgi:predicted Ser/Thr protein kinase